MSDVVLKTKGLEEKNSFKINLTRTKDCIKINYSNETEKIFENKRIVLILARTECSEEEWQEAEKCAEKMNMTLEVEYGKVL